MSAAHFQHLLAEIDDAFRTGVPDYRGSVIDREHVRRYLRLSWHRVIELRNSLCRTDGPREILEIGPAYGFLCFLLREAGHQVEALELPDNIPVYGRLLTQHEIPLHAGALGGDLSSLSGRQYDCIVVAEVLEHLRVAPLRALAELRPHLRPGGSLLLTTPNIARLPNLVRLATGNNILQPLPDDDTQLDHVTDTIHHLREYTRRELVALVRRAGYRVLKSRFSSAGDRTPMHATPRQRVLHTCLTLAGRVFPPWRGLLWVVATPA
jgi:2-polyprenyl-3-methyl-5-hydroxy-6-metoxy-1,4-benzoquinol methylase